LLNIVAGTGKELRELRAEAITEYPQILHNVLTGRMVDLAGAEQLWEEVKGVEEELGDEGRVLVRPSGTEPLVRIMVEASSESTARMYAERLASAMKVSLGQE
jgi:phosphoglucosamine mutase